MYNLWILACYTIQFILFCIFYRFYSFIYITLRPYFWSQSPQPRSPKSNCLLSRPNRLLFLVDLGKAAPKPKSRKPALHANKNGSLQAGGCLSKFTFTGKILNSRTLKFIYKKQTFFKNWKYNWLDFNNCTYIHDTYVTQYILHTYRWVFLLENISKMYFKLDILLLQG